MINVNKVVLVGRLTKDIELRKTQSNISVVSFTVAVNRRFKNEKGEYEADFINCIAWRQAADFLNDYAIKGDMVSVEGNIQTRSYDGPKGKVYITEVVAENVQLISNRKEEPMIANVPKEVVEEEKSKGVENVIEGVQAVHIDQMDLPFY